MSTHCGISIKTEKGYETIYCHSGGNPGYMWPMLTENYNSEEAAKKIVSLGDASFIDERLEPSPTYFHSFNNREPGVSVFYHRDRGEDYCKTIYTTKQELLNTYYHAYIWEDGHWNAYVGERKIRGFEEE